MTTVLIILSILAFVFLAIGIIITNADLKKRHEAEQARKMEIRQAKETTLL